jgi:multidrug efflux system outer membrane protein
VRIAVLLFSAVVAAAASAGAQTTLQTPQIEFDEAVRRAIERHPTVAQAVTNISRAEALLQQSRAVNMPFVNANVTNTTIDDARGFQGGVTQPRSQVAFSASVGVQLSAARWAAANQARDQIEVASRSTDEVRQQIGLAAAQAYLTVIAGHRQVEVDQRSLETSRAHLDYARKRMEGGAGSRLNYVRAAQLVAADEARLENTRLALRRAQEALGVLVVEHGPVDTGAEPTLDVPATIDAAQWRQARPDILLQTAVQRAAERTLRDSMKDWWPAVGASFDPTFITPSGLFQPSRSWRLTLSFSQPVFEGGQRRAQRALRQVALDESRLGLSLLELEAESAVRLAQASLESTQRALASARQSAEHAAEVLRITTAAFEVGATTNLEVIDAQRSARDAESTSTLAEDAVRRARLDLLVAIGRFPK